MADIILPAAETPVLDGNKLARPWYAFFDAVTKKLNTQAAFIADIGGAPSASDFNGLLEALQDADLMETS